ncbi:hypothetical protein AMECASPLE_026753 [Ameca splendens]|uniref:Uncharacterized protein n=1 Tax=Ameca splendens TaxID=208324 RepID=A0ABV1ACZ1_9TELE
MVVCPVLPCEGHSSSWISVCLAVCLLMFLNLSNDWYLLTLLFDDDNNNNNNNNNNLVFIDLTMKTLSSIFNPSLREQWAAIVRHPRSIQGSKGPAQGPPSSRLWDSNNGTCGLSMLQMPCSLTTRSPFPPLITMKMAYRFLVF